MHAVDFVVCKAGGLIVTEALACGLPLMLIDVIEGQETGNAEFVVDNGAGDIARMPLDMLETLYHWLSNDAQHPQIPLVMFTLHDEFGRNRTHSSAIQLMSFPV